MPTYRYVCQNCGYEFTELQNMSDKPLRKCPECGRLKLQRLIGKGMGIIFKGSGFYTTDYNRSSSYKDKKKAETTKSSDNKNAKSDNKKSDAAKKAG